MSDVIAFQQNGNGARTPVSSAQPLPVTAVSSEDTVSLTKSTVTMTGASATLVSANAARQIVVVCNASSNSAAAVDPTGGTCSLTSGMPIGPGGTLTFTGVAAQSAMTQFGTNTQTLTVYTG